MEEFQDFQAGILKQSRSQTQLLTAPIPLSFNCRASKGLKVYQDQEVIRYGIFMFTDSPFDSSWRTARRPQQRCHPFPLVFLWRLGYKAFSPRWRSWACIVHVGQILPYPPNIVNRNCIFLSKNVVVYTIFYTFFFFRRRKNKILYTWP